MADEESTRVRARYDFNYTPVQNDETTAISFKQGDEWILVNKTSDNWWLVRHTKGSKSFYVPATYVEIVEESIPTLRSPRVLPKPKPRAISTIGSLEDSVLKELDCILDNEENLSPSTVATFSNADDDGNSDTDSEACYANIPAARAALTSFRPSNRHADSETSDYRTDSHESLDSDGTAGISSNGTRLPTAASPSTVDKRAKYKQPVYENCDFNRGTSYDSPQDTYANLDEIQKVIHSSKSPSSPASPAGAKSPGASDSPGFVDTKFPSPVISASSKSPAYSNIEPVLNNHCEHRINRPPPKLVEKQGHLNRAKTMDNGKTKKPKWSVSYMLLLDETLFFCKDLKTEPKKQMSLKNLGKPEATLNLTNATICRKSSTEKNKPEVLEITIAGNVQYYLHHSDEAVMKHWEQSLDNNIAVLKSEASVATKPTRTSLERREVFGTPLAALCERDGLPVPRFIQECLFAVEHRGLQVDGIYRVGGNVALVQKLKTVVDQNEFYDFNSNEWDIHVVTSALKLFFRELPEPLFPFNKFDQFLQSFGLPERQAKITGMLKLISSLPQVNVDTMQMLIRHLSEVTKHHTENRMLAQNLAIVFGPTLMWSPDDGGNLVVSMVQQGQLIEFLINDCRTLFPSR